MEDNPSISKHLRNKEKVTFMLEGMMMEYLQQPTSQKKVDIPCLVALVSNVENQNQFALVLIAKKNKKIEVVLPLTVELQFIEKDSLNIIWYWDPQSVDQQSSPLTEVTQSSTFKVRVMCNHAGEKRNLLDRIINIRQFLSREQNTFANQKTHNWLWHYSSMIPKSVQTKTQTLDISQDLSDSNENFINQQLSNAEKLKETIDQIKSSNIQMSKIAMDIFLKQELDKRQNQFMVEHDYKILTFTWNVNGQKPPVDEIEDIFTVKDIYLDTRNLEINSMDDIPDLIVFNFQEIVPLNAKSMIMTGLQPQLWEKYLIQEFNQYFYRRLQDKLEIANISYVDKLASHGQMGLYQVILYRKDRSHLISDFALAQVGTGILGVGGNKGAIGCSIRICETKIAIINAHLAASQSKVQRRNQNVTQIIKNLSFTSKNIENLNLFEHDILVWCGDLNYRINSDSFEEVVEKIQSNKISELRNLDQLRQEKSAGNVFVEFEEGKIKFPPTYKFKVGTQEYDSVKVRIPAWCDRILYRGENIQQLFYTSIASPTTSDHKPVASLFKIKYKQIDPVQQKIVTNSILDYLKNLKENFIPKIKLSSKEITFENVRYGDTQFMKLDIENEGDGLLEFEINRSDDRQGVSKNVSWLMITPMRDVVKQGEKKSITFKIQINQREAQLMFLYKDISEFVQILTNEPEPNNKQIVEIKCQYLRSCFGAAISILNQCVGVNHSSIRSELQQLTFEDVVLLMDSRRLNSFTLPIPKEMHKIINFILDHGKIKPNIFLSSGNLSLQTQIREKIDTNQELDAIEDDVYTVAFVLVDFLQTLLTPILPVQILDDIVSLYEMYGDQDEMVLQQLLFRLPKDNSMAFVYLLSFFKEMLNYSDKNKLTPEKISEILCECLIGEDKMQKNSKFRRDSLVRAAPKKSPTRTTRNMEDPQSLVRPNSITLGPNFFGSMRTLTNVQEDDNQHIFDFGNGDGEGADKLSSEQLKSKLRYQGLLLHFFQ